MNVLFFSNSFQTKMENPVRWVHHTIICGLVSEKLTAHFTCLLKVCQAKTYRFISEIKVKENIWRLQYTGW